MKFIPVAEPTFGKEEEKLVRECVRSSWISSTGKYIELFEQAFAKHFHIPYAVTCSNGTVALHLALLALGIGQGDEVIVPALTFVATANAVLYTGARPVFVDVEPDTWLLNPGLLEERISPKTRAIIPVHLYGYPVDMNRIMNLAKKYKLSVIEDAAEAHGAKYFGKYVGTIGDIGCFSFYGNKIITTGEGGMLVTSSKKLADKIRLYKNHGMSPDKRYYHPVIGYNYRMTNIQAAIGLAQLKRINEFLKKRTKIEKMYRKFLRNIPGIIFQPIQEGYDYVCWMFSMRLTRRFGKSRAKLMAHLKHKGIDSRPFFYPLTTFPMYKSSGIFKHTETIAKTGLNLPSSPNLTEKQICYIADTIRQFQK